MIDFFNHMASLRCGWVIYLPILALFLAIICAILEMKGFKKMYNSKQLPKSDPEKVKKQIIIGLIIIAVCILVLFITRNL